MKKSREKGGISAFFRRKSYLVLLAICIVSLGVMVAFIITSQTPNTPPEVVTPDPDPDPDPDPGDNTGDTIVFMLPVNNGVIGMTFSDDMPVFHQTLNTWTAHMGMDIKGPEGAECLAVYAGEVISITTTIQDGTVIKIKHNDDLTTLYASLDSNVEVAVGDKVKKGDVIGYISDSAYDSYKEGPHVHLEVWEKGVRVDPNKYLLTEEK